MTAKNETYIGDGLYASYDGFAVWLRAPRPHSNISEQEDNNHVVALEPQTMHNFIEFVLTIERHAKIVKACVREKVSDE